MKQQAKHSDKSLFKETMKKIAGFARNRTQFTGQESVTLASASISLIMCYLTQLALYTETN